MADPLKYARVERERRFLVARIPDGVIEKKQIVDRYVTGTRLRLREVIADDGTVTRKLTHKVPLGAGAAEVACTNFYLDGAEWDLLREHPARVLGKTRHMLHRDEAVVAIDELEDGTLLAEIDDGDAPSDWVPEWLDVIEDVTDDERWTGAALAR